MRKTCFVMMPFKDKFESLYRGVIEPTVQAAGLEPLRGCSYEPGSIPDQIDRDITSAAVSIAILTEGNWNVAYEMGIAHKAGVPVIALIEAAPEEIPGKIAFDVRHHRIVPYRPTAEGYEELRQVLRESLPKLHDERLLAELLAPSSLECQRSVIAAAPLAYRDARRKTGGSSQFRETYSDHVGIRGLLRALAIIRGFDGLPELWNPNDFMDAVLEGDARVPPSQMTVYSIGSPKSNRFTGLLMKKFFESHRPRFAFVADERSEDLRDVSLSLKRNDVLYAEGLESMGNNRKDEDIGIVIRGPNPFFPKGMMLILAGRSALGTEAACRAAVEPRGVKMIVQHLETFAASRGLSNMGLSDHSKAFWATVTMRGDWSARAGDPSSLIVQAAQYFV